MAFKGHIIISGKVDVNNNCCIHTEYGDYYVEEPLNGNGGKYVLVSGNPVLEHDTLFIENPKFEVYK